MALSIRSAEVERMARELSRRTGEGMTDAIKEALEARLGESEKALNARKARLTAIAKECRAARTIDARSEDEILGYGTDGGFYNGGR
jgi:antitoxin VapB